MPRRQPRKDVNQVAYATVRQATGTSDLPTLPPEKNPAAVALGKLGGAKGGNARAAALSGRRRKAIAKKAALARWAKH